VPGGSPDNLRGIAAMADAVNPGSMAGHAGHHAPHGGHGAHGHGHVAHHFDSAEQQFDSGKLGMWLFLATEILLFGGLFCAYAVWRGNHPELFIYGHHHLDTTMGAINTVVLLLSSFTMAWAVTSAQRGNQFALKLGLFLTLLGGATFMVIKYFEYKKKIDHGYLWGKYYNPVEHHDDAHASAGAGGHTGSGGHTGEVPKGSEAHDSNSPMHGDAPQQGSGAAHGQDATGATGSSAQPAHAPVAATLATVGHAPPPVAPALDTPGHPFMPVGVGEEALKHLNYEPTKIAAAATAIDGVTPPVLPNPPEPHTVRMFFSIYFCMTGLHGAHVLIGMIVIAWLLWKSIGGAFSPEYFTPVDLGGLYWHLVDLIWIYLFPLLYLIH
jgi:cytochrome c oxidase subunit 3